MSLAISYRIITNTIAIPPLQVSGLSPVASWDFLQLGRWTPRSKEGIPLCFVRDMDRLYEALRQLREAHLLLTDLAVHNGHKLFLYDYADKREPTGALECEVLNQKS